MRALKFFLSYLEISTRSRMLFLAFFLIGFFIATFPAYARKTSFNDSHYGLYTGGGTYFHWLPHDNLWDPVPGLFADGTTVTGSKSTYLLPVRAGFFKDTPKSNFLIYGIYMTNLLSAWDASGTATGSGSTYFASYGAGAEVDFSLYQQEYIRLNFAVNGEYVLQKALVSFTESNATENYINLSATSYLIGIGLNPEIWLGDMYVLSLFAGYQYGFKKSWTVDEDSGFAGNNFTAGDLTNPSSGLGVIAQFGGFYIAAGLKLNF